MILRFSALFAAAAALFASPVRAEITVYSGRSESLIGPAIEQYEQQTGNEVSVRYGDSAELAATILEEGKNSPADVFFSQDAGALGALEAYDTLAPLSPDLLEKVPAKFHSATGHWVGVSGRARVVVYNTDALTPDDLPDSVLGFTDPKWKGRIGWAPTNGSFQSFITAMRVQLGEEKTREWIEGIIANEPRVYPNNSSIVTAVGAGEIDVGLTNHYYLHRFIEERGEEFAARNHFLAGGDPGALINVAGVGILQTSEKKDEARQFVEYLLSAEAQRYFAEETYEYPLVEEHGIEIHPLLTPLAKVESPDIDLSRLDDLEGTLQLLQETGALE